jgi:hypothetical protein
VSADSSGRQRFVDNILKWFGDLGSIFSLPSMKKIDSMASIRGRELRRTPAQRLLER